MGGAQPNLSDLAVFGVLNAIEGCEAFQVDFVFENFETCCTPSVLGRTSQHKDWSLVRSDEGSCEHQWRQGPSGRLQLLKLFHF